MASIKSRIEKAIIRLGVPIEYLQAIPSTSLPQECPCMNNPWHKYDPKWHTEHPDAPHCHGSGKIVQEQDTSLQWLTLTKAIVIPNYQAKGTDMEWLMAGQYPEWAWLCVTSDRYNMLRVKLKDHQFKVVATLPYFMEGNIDTTTATIYLLQPLTTEELL